LQVIFHYNVQEVIIIYRCYTVVFVHNVYSCYILKNCKLNIKFIVFDETKVNIYNQSRRLFMDEDKTFSDNFSCILIFLL
jgi:hypothetical protein